VPVSAPEARTCLSRAGHPRVNGGERDVCRPPAEEVATFKAATDISVFVVPRIAHMRNFADTRALLWERLEEFVAHVTRGLATPTS
jgi:hypothetical protein